MRITTYRRISLEHGRISKKSPNGGGWSAVIGCLVRPVNFGSSLAYTPPTKCSIVLLVSAE
jgi:hypothetical protein